LGVGALLLVGCGGSSSDDPGTTQSNSTEATPVEWVAPQLPSVAAKATAGTCPASVVGFYTPLSTDDKDWAGPGVLCSGVLVAPNKIATAKHCHLKKGRAYYWFPGEDLTPIWKSRRDNIAADEYEDFWSDYGQITLTTPSTVTPALVGDADAAKKAGLSLSAAGFSGMPVCHAPTVGTPDYFYAFGGKFSTSVSPFQTAGGDSGGPLFAVNGTTVTVYGVVHGEAQMWDGKTHGIFTKIPSPLP
jgi:hypothetical protein